MLTATHLFKRGLFTALLLCLATTLFAQGTFSVVSTNDGNGQFSWIFSVSGGSYPEVDQFKMKLYGVQDTFSPLGWTRPQMQTTLSPGIISALAERPLPAYPGGSVRTSAIDAHELIKPFSVATM